MSSVWSVCGNYTDYLQRINFYVGGLGPAGAGQCNCWGLGRGSGGHKAAASAKLLQLCPTLCDPMAAAYQAPPSIGFSMQECWSGMPLPSPPSVHKGVHIFPFYKDISHVGLGPH